MSHIWWQTLWSLWYLWTTDISKYFPDDALPGLYNRNLHFLLVSGCVCETHAQLDWGQVTDLASEEHLAVLARNNSLVPVLLHCLKIGGLCMKRAFEYFESQRLLKLKVKTCLIYFILIPVCKDKDKTLKMMLLMMIIISCTCNTSSLCCISNYISHVHRGFISVKYGCVCVFLYMYCSCLDFSFRLRLKQEMANRQDSKYATKANAQTLSSASPNMGQIENRPLKNTLQVLHMLNSTLSPFPPFRFAHHPFRNCKLKTNGKSRSNGRKTNNRSEGERERHASEQTAECTDLQRRQLDLTKYQTTSGQFVSWERCF